ncbi:hypothetical protein BVRB_3g051290 [Beta vulgaris subsp. vulgaris]|nr:hypothetical protein BVRB_3g051290 [Beta vulgaris subsp. vulgaris]
MVHPITNPPPVGVYVCSRFGGHLSLPPAPDCVVTPIQYDFSLSKVSEIRKE